MFRAVHAFGVALEDVLMSGEMSLMLGSELNLPAGTCDVQLKGKIVVVTPRPLASRPGATEHRGVREVFIIHVGGTHGVTSSTDHSMKIQARITLTVECIRTCICVFLSLLYDQD